MIHMNRARCPEQEDRFNRLTCKYRVPDVQRAEYGFCASTYTYKSRPLKAIEEIGSAGSLPRAREHSHLNWLQCHIRHPPAISSANDSLRY